MKSVRVIIPVYNDWDRLKSCLEALDQQNYPKDFYEVIVVDNGSDIIPDFEEYKFNLELKFCETKGSYAARNYGLTGNTADIIAFTDSDCIPGENWIEEGVKALLNEPSPDLLAGEIEIFPESPNLPRIAELFDMATGFPQKRYVEHSKFGVTANLFVKASAFKLVGKFDENLKSGGDTEFGNRSVKHGLKLQYSSKAIVKHPARKTIGEIYKKVKRMTGGRLDRLDTKKKKILSLYKHGRPPLRGLWYVLRSNLSLIQRLKASFVIPVVWYAQVEEWVNIVILNKSSNRS